MIQRYKTAAISESGYRISNAFKKDDKGPAVMFTDHLATMKEKEKTIKDREGVCRVQAKIIGDLKGVREAFVNALSSVTRQHGEIKERDDKIAALTAENEKLKDETVCVNCHNALEDKITALISKMKSYFIAAEYQNVDKLLLGSEEMYVKIGKVAIERIKAIITDRDTAISMLEDAEGRVKKRDEEIAWLRGHVDLLNADMGEQTKKANECLASMDLAIDEFGKSQHENEVLREQNSAMNTLLVKLRPEVDRLREEVESILRISDLWLIHPDHITKENKGEAETLWEAYNILQDALKQIEPECNHVFGVYNDRVSPALLACKYCGEIAESGVKQTEPGGGG
jgi:hypothetical protein